MNTISEPAADWRAKGALPPAGDNSRKLNDVAAHLAEMLEGRRDGFGIPRRDLGALPPGKRLLAFRNAALVNGTRYVRANSASDVAPVLMLWLYALADNEKGESWMSLARLGRLLKRSPRAISAALDRLVEMGAFGHAGNDGSAGNSGTTKRVWPLIEAMMTEVHILDIADHLAPQRAAGRPVKHVSGEKPGAVERRGLTPKPPAADDRGLSKPPAADDRGPGENPCRGAQNPCREPTPDTSFTSLPCTSKAEAAAGRAGALDAGGDYLPEFITSEGKGFVAKVPYDTKDGSGIARIKVEISHVRQLAGGLKISEREARTLMIEQLGEWHSARFGGGRDWLPRLIADCKRRHESAVEIASILAEPDRGREPIEVGIVGPLHGVSIPQEIADAMRSLPAARKLLGDEIAAALARGIMRHVVEGQLRAAVVHQIGKANGGRLMPADVVRGACSFVTTARNPKGVSQPAQLEREVAYFAALPADQLGSIHDGGWED